MSLFGTTLAILLAFLLGGGVAFYAVRARARERAPLSAEPRDPIAEEVRAIGSQIEQAMAEQRLQGETQRQVLTQKIDGVRQTVDTQAVQVDGLRGELRHEIQRRDQEMAELRAQLSAPDSDLALPASTSTALPLAPAPDTPEPETFEPDPLNGHDQEVEEMTSIFEQFSTAQHDGEDEALAAPQAQEIEEAPMQDEDASFEEVAFEEVAFEETSDTRSDAPDDDSSTEEVSFEEVSFEAPPFESAPPPSSPSGDSAFEEVSFMPPAAPQRPAVSDSVFEDVFAEMFAPATTNAGDGVSSTVDEPWSLSPPSTTDEVAPSSQEEPAHQPTGEISSSEASVDVAEDVDIIQGVDTAVDTEAPEPTPAAPSFEETAWIARPDRPEPAHDKGPTGGVIADDLFLTPPPAPESFEEIPAAPPPADSESVEIPMAMPSPAPSPDVDLHSTPPSVEPVPVPELAEPVAEMPPAAAAPVEEVAPTPNVPSALAPDALPRDTPAPEPEAATEAPYTPPEDADDLTVVSSIDEDTQRLLYMAGVLTLEEIAQWSPTDARRVSGQVSVSEATIMNQWVFEAQAALFNLYAQRAGR